MEVCEVGIRAVEDVATGTSDGDAPRVGFCGAEVEAGM